MSPNLNSNLAHQFYLKLIRSINFLFNRRMQKINPSKASHFKYQQVFGYKGPNEKILDEDVISTLKFDDSGRFLAVGDKAGRVIVFEGKDNKKGIPSFDYFTEFQSHSKEFDPLRSMEVQEEIVGMQWLRPQGRYLKLATTNPRTIKIWKMFERSEKKVVKSAGKELSMPKLQVVDTGYVAQMQKSFPNRHINPINAISITKNQEYVLSSDEGQIFMWSLQKPDQPFMMVNYCPKVQTEEQKEMVTCSDVHPTSDSLFVYGMSKGTLRMGDLRTSADVQANGLALGEAVNHKSYIYELLSSYTGATFLKNGKYIATRDCLSVKIWDICAPKKPVSTIMINDGIKSKLCEMVQNQAIFDKFGIKASHDGNSILTGSYNNNFHLLDVEDGSNSQYELNYKKTTLMKQMGKGSTIGRMDYSTKTIAGDFNSKKNLLAVASKNCFFTYTM